MINTVATAKNDVKEIVMSALGKLVAEGKLPAEPKPTGIFPATPLWYPPKRSSRTPAPLLP